MSAGSFSIFLSRPISLAILLVPVVIILIKLLKIIFEKESRVQA